MLATTGLTWAGTSTAHIRSLEMQTPVASMFSAKSLDLQLVDEQLKIGKFANPHHYAVLFIDGKSASKPGHKTPMPSPRWPSFHFNISSTLKIAIFRKRRVHKDTLVAEYTGKGRDFLDRGSLFFLRHNN
ncbi:hypothetical protein FIBSPDRAFT_239838 [Athelia psychrophila]|uniref:Uncharacterized protein n=1 Tax=Athelia psychrophila TaxID=1759441 RepID=A0A165YD89_9AGAM|nr:hypothetical protein FIBSPDRAFT_239838 [Fibularhizoctonia sp. CBS 109695]